MQQEEVRRVLKRARENEWMTLDLSGEDLTTIPDDIGKITSLARLNLSNNRLSELPESLGQLNRLVHLDVSDNQLQSLPESLGEIKRLSVLKAGNNHLTLLPDSIGNLTRLSDLELNENRLTYIPDTIGSLASLHRLILSTNRLTDLPESMHQLTNLQALLIEDNRLATLPSKFGGMTSLNRLDLSDNRLTELPESIGQLVNLIECNVSCNALKKLPESIGKLIRLQTFLIHDNCLNTLPESIGKLRKISRFEVYNNPLGYLPQEVMQEGSQAILEFYLELKTIKTRRFEGRVILVGEPGAGKTTLARALTGSRDDALAERGGIYLRRFFARIQENPKMEITAADGRATGDPKNMATESFTDNAAFKETIHGLEATNLVRRDKKDEESETFENVRMVVWDFGGTGPAQQAYQHFLTDRTLYLLVFNATHSPDQQRLEYWLQTVKACAPQSRILLVATQAGDAVPNSNFRELKQKYGSFLCGNDIFWVDSVAGTGVAELRDEVTTLSRRLQFIGYNWPKSWADVEEQLESRLAGGQVYLRRLDLYKLMVDCGIKTDWNRDLLARILGKMGKIIHFPYSHQLHDLVVLDMPWLTRAIAALFAEPATDELDDDKIGQSDSTPPGEPGIIGHDRLISCWRKDYLNLAPVLTQILEDYGICCPLGEDKSKSLLPLLLPPDRPPLPVWEKANNKSSRRFVYRLDYLPDTLIPQIIAHTFRWHYGPVWRHGVMLANGPSLALIEADPLTCEITVEVRAAYPFTYLEMLVRAVETVLRLFPGLTAITQISCPGHPPARPDCTGLFDIEDIRRDLTEGAMTRKCEASGAMIKTPDIIEGFSGYTQAGTFLENMELAITATIDLVRSGKARAQQLLEMLEHQQHVFMEWLWDLDRDLFVNGPTLFSLIPSGGRRVRSETWFNQEYSMRVCCQSPTGIHPVGRAYPMKRPREWWLITAPYFSQLMPLLNVLAGPSGQLLFGHLPEHLIRTVKGEFEVMQHTFRRIGVTTLDAPADETGHERLRDRQHRALTEVLGIFNQIDKWETWRESLARMRMADGRFLWLCEDHFNQFQPRVASFGLENVQKKTPEELLQSARR